MVLSNVKPGRVGKPTSTGRYNNYVSHVSKYSRNVCAFPKTRTRGQGQIDHIRECVGECVGGWVLSAMLLSQLVRVHEIMSYADLCKITFCDPKCTDLITYIHWPLENCKQLSHVMCMACAACPLYYYAYGRLFRHLTAFSSRVIHTSK